MCEARCCKLGPNLRAARSIGCHCNDIALLGLRRELGNRREANLAAKDEGGRTPLDAVVKSGDVRFTKDLELAAATRQK